MIESTATAYAFNFSFDRSAIGLYADWNSNASVVALTKVSSSIVVPNAAPPLLTFDPETRRALGRKGEAVGLGLVNRTFPAETFLDDVLDVARPVASRAPLATRLTQVALADGGPASFEAALAWESVAQPVTMVTEDLREGIRAQRERRPARFTGR